MDRSAAFRHGAACLRSTQRFTCQPGKSGAQVGCRTDERQGWMGETVRPRCISWVKGSRTPALRESNRSGGRAVTGLRLLLSRRDAPCERLSSGTASSERSIARPWPMSVTANPECRTAEHGFLRSLTIGSPLVGLSVSPAKPLPRSLNGQERTGIGRLESKAVNKEKKRRAVRKRPLDAQTRRQHGDKRCR